MPHLLKPWEKSFLIAQLSWWMATGSTGRVSMLRSFQTCRDEWQHFFGETMKHMSEFENLVKNVSQKDPNLRFQEVDAWGFHHLWLRAVELSHNGHDFRVQPQGIQWNHVGKIFVLPLNQPVGWPQELPHSTAVLQYLCQAEVSRFAPLLRWWWPRRGGRLRSWGLLVGLPTSRFHFHWGSHGKVPATRMCKTKFQWSNLVQPSSQKFIPCLVHRTWLYRGCSQEKRPMSFIDPMTWTWDTVTPAQSTLNWLVTRQAHHAPNPINAAEEKLSAWNEFFDVLCDLVVIINLWSTWAIMQPSKPENAKNAVNPQKAPLDSKTVFWLRGKNYTTLGGSRYMYILCVCVWSWTGL